jgi:hypothetical protein
MYMHNCIHTCHNVYPLPPQTTMGEGMLCVQCCVCTYILVCAMYTHANRVYILCATHVGIYCTVNYSYYLVCY